MISNRETAQRRVVNMLVRRNLQGWGKPMRYTMRRIQFGGGLLGVGIVIALLLAVLAGPQRLLHPAGGSVGFAWFVMVLSILGGSGFWYNTVPNWFIARTRPVQTFQGVVKAAICDVHETQSFVTDHFITVRFPDGQLRAFAIPPDRHDRACHPGQTITLSVIPGIDYVQDIR